MADFLQRNMGDQYYPELTEEVLSTWGKMPETEQKGYNNEAGAEAIARRIVAQRKAETPAPAKPLPPQTSRAHVETGSGPEPKKSPSGLTVEKINSSTPEEHARRVAALTDAYFGPDVPYRE